MEVRVRKVTQARARTGGRGPEVLWVSREYLARLASRGYLACLASLVSRGTRESTGGWELLV